MTMSAAATSPLTGISRACEGTTPHELYMWEKKEYTSAGAVEGAAAARLGAPCRGQTLCVQPLRPQSRCACGAHWHTGAHGSGVEGKRPMRTGRYRRSDRASRFWKKRRALLSIHAPQPRGTAYFSHTTRLLHAAQGKSRRPSQLYMHLPRQLRTRLETPGVCARKPCPTRDCSKGRICCLHVTALAPGMRISILHLAPVLPVSKPRLPIVRGLARAPA